VRVATLPAKHAAAAVLASVLVVPAAVAADQWIKLKSSHFELYTTAGEKKGREAILYFEQVRDFFSKAMPQSKAAQGAAARIVAFRSEKEYKPYRPSEAAAAFYVSGYDRDYIVMQSIATENYPVAIHEFTHMLVEHSGAELPVWSNEGLAELYSTLKPAGKKMQIGDIIPGHFLALRDNKWLPLDALLSVDQKSPYYNERNRAGLFYSESWALMHMLMLSPAYRAQFGKFLATVASGVPGGSALWQTFAKTTAQVQKDLDEYLHGNRFYAVFFDIKLQKSDEEPDIEPAQPLESGMVLGDLLSLSDKREEAAGKYESVAKEFPKSWEPEAGLAELAWRARDVAGARRHFARAAELGSTNPRLYYDYAMVLHETGEKDAALAPVLKRAVDLDPEYQEAHRYLAYCLLATDDYAGAVEHFTKVKQVKRDEAFSYYRALAYANYRLDKKDAAKTAADAARKFARTPDEIASAEEMLRALNQQPVAQMAERAVAAESAPPAAQTKPMPRTVGEEPEEEKPRRLIRRAEPAEGPDAAAPGAKPTSSVEGLLQQIDCLGKVVRLRVLASRKQVMLVITDPQTVTVKGSATGTLDLACGPQKAKTVVVEYDSRPDARLGTIGIVRSMEFK
jgi:Flp pilus assembly protein TadD